MWLVLILSACFMWGTGQVLAKRGMAKISAPAILFATPLLRLLVWVPYSAANGIQAENPLFIFLIAVIYCVGLVLYYEAIATGDVSIAGTLPAAYPVVTMILASVFLHEVTSPVQKLAIAGVAAGILVLGLTPGGSGVKMGLSRSTVLAILSLFVFGLQEFLTKVALAGTSASGIMFYMLMAQVPFFIIYALVNWRSVSFGDRPSQLWAGAGLMLFNVGFIAYFVALQQERVSLLSPIAAAYPVITIILARFLLKETLNRGQLAGVATVLVSSVGLAF